jgi:hypothetical protein
MRLNIFYGVISVIVLLFSPFPSYAENWVEYYFHTATNNYSGNTMSAIESFYDNDSLRFINDSTFKVWIKQSTQHNGDMANYLGKSHESKKLIIINCEIQTFEVVSGGVDATRLPPEGKFIAEKLNRGDLNTSLAFKKLADTICPKNKNNP